MWNYRFITPLKAKRQPVLTSSCFSVCLSVRRHDNSKRFDRFSSNLAWGSLWTKTRNLLIFSPQGRRSKSKFFNLLIVYIWIARRVDHDACLFGLEWPRWVNNRVQMIYYHTLLMLYITRRRFSLALIIIASTHQRRRYDCYYSGFIWLRFNCNQKTLHAISAHAWMHLHKEINWKSTYIHSKPSFSKLVAHSDHD